eukprot:5822812-Pyramimonas_sp.AAC.1
MVDLNCGVPPIILLLEVQLYLAPRFLRSRQWVSMPIFASKGITAGPPHGTTLARPILLPILRQARAQADLAQMWTFVDDTVLRVEGVLRTLQKHLPRAAKTLCD